MREVQPREGEGHMSEVVIISPFRKPSQHMKPTYSTIVSKPKIDS